MILIWLVYRDAAGRRVVMILRAGGIVLARLRAALSGLDHGNEFVEAHELDAKTAKRVPKSAIGKRLSQREAAKVLAAIGS